MSGAGAEVGAELTLTITDLSRGGSGVGRTAEGQVVFVPLTAPGDRVRARIVEIDKRFCQAELLEVLEASAERVEPRCAVFGRCGGCQWQHLSYARQWATKVSGVRHALERVQVALPGPMTELPADKIWEYRNRVQLRGFRDALGLYARGSNELVPAQRCEIARPEINREWGAVRANGAARARPYKVELEVLPDGSLRMAWNSPHAAGGFRQVHDEQNERLQAWVKANVTPGRPVLDLYGGEGNLSLPLLLEAMAPEIDCVDVGSPRDAERPPELSQTYRFHRSEVVPWLLREVKRRGGRPSKEGPLSVILDPPRAGLGPAFPAVADAVQALGAEELLAVGCDPDSWARDVSRFVRRGWRLEKAGVLDLFPQTPHVESLAVLRR